MFHINELKEAALEKVAHILPNTIFQEFDQPNSRMLIAVTLMNRGEKELAYQLFESIAAYGPDENENRHFAYVRSLIEMAEMDAEKERFVKAEAYMMKALAEFPDSMGYMMSRTHLEVYHSYYLFKLGKKEAAHRELEKLILREGARFASLPQEDGQNLVGPALCYAIHQLALFHAEEGDWEGAATSFERLLPYVIWVDEEGWNEGDRMMKEGKKDVGFQRMVEAVTYDAS
ncbi:hypothetical protein SAMN05444487_109133 [Marininema mesophilum]|uniref:Tetratricopeptide repeat-containing protein n=1 Tax=Marininema mesophilum TaxID=1048340 RepID=A0A1H2YPB3_9BACL|nr:hypothetical protein [Marininema mesophilum]SDX06484.1 hypothetical protein SAMN05444487_109133 [Marininema mesophilum]